VTSGVELAVDDRAVTHETAQSQVALDQRRQRGERGPPVDLVRLQDVHGDIAALERAGPQRRRRKVVVEKVGERQRHLLGLRPMQAGAAEQQFDVVVQYVFRYAAPEQLHDGAGAVVGVDAGAAELQDLARIAHERRDVVLARRIEAARAHRRAAAHQPIGSDHAVGPAPQGAVDHQQMVAVVVEAVELPSHLLHLRGRLGVHLLDEHVVAQPLGRVQLLPRLREADLQIARAYVDRPVVLVLQSYHDVLILAPLNPESSERRSLAVFYPRSVTL
jgi:hypothetical protein